MCATVHVRICIPEVLLALTGTANSYVTSLFSARWAQHWQCYCTKADSVNVPGFMWTGSHILARRMQAG